MTLVCVTLSDPDDWNDHMRLYDWAYKNYALHDLSAELSFEVPVISGSREHVSVILDHTVEQRPDAACYALPLSSDRGQFPAGCPAQR